MGSSRTRARTRVPCIGRQTLNHCTTTEALKWTVNALQQSYYISLVHVRSQNILSDRKTKKLSKENFQSTSSPIYLPNLYLLAFLLWMRYLCSCKINFSTCRLMLIPALPEGHHPRLSFLYVLCHQILLHHSHWYIDRLLIPPIIKSNNKNKTSMTYKTPSSNFIL